MPGTTRSGNAGRPTLVRHLSIEQRARQVRLMVFDVDGVLTDGSLHYNEHGEAIKVFNVLDGHGIKALASAGIVTAIISGRSSPIIARRAADLDIAHVFEGVKDKRAAFEALLARTGLTADASGFMGDDVIDLPVMRIVALAATVPNAADGIAAHAHWISRRGGGQGAAREVCDLILRAQGKLDDNSHDHGHAGLDGRS